MKTYCRKITENLEDNKTPMKTKQNKYNKNQKGTIGWTSQLCKGSLATEDRTEEDRETVEDDTLLVCTHGTRIDRYNFFRNLIYWWEIYLHQNAYYIRNLMEVLMMNPYSFCLYSHWIWLWNFVAYLWTLEAPKTKRHPRRLHSRRTLLLSKVLQHRVYSYSARAR